MAEMQEVGAIALPLVVLAAELEVLPEQLRVAGLRERPGAVGEARASRILRQSAHPLDRVDRDVARRAIERGAHHAVEMLDQEIAHRRERYDVAHRRAERRQHVGHDRIADRPYPRARSERLVVIGAYLDADAVAERQQVELEPDR